MNVLYAPGSDQVCIGLGIGCDQALQAGGGMTYHEWTQRPMRVLLRQPDGTTHWVMLTGVIGPFDARSQAKYSWPEAEIVEVKAEQPIDNYPVPIYDSEANSEICQRCGCLWEIEVMGEPNRKREWCREIDRDSGCLCHQQGFVDAYFASLDRLDASKEDVLAELEPRDAA